MNHAWNRAFATVAAVVVLVAVSACDATNNDAAPAPSGSVNAENGHAVSPSGSTTSPTVTPKKHYPTGPPMDVQSIAPSTGETVGVAMPISIVFAKPVAAKAHEAIERALHLTTSTPVTGAWHWFGERRVDFRPKTFWKSGTTVALDAKLKHVGDGNGRYGTHGYTRQFTIGDDVRTHVYVKAHRTVVTRNGEVIRTMPSDAGSPTWPTWTGTLAVVNKAATVQMDSCSVHISCNKGSSDYYNLSLPWDVRITWSGTFLHYSPADPHPGHANGSHGCVHLSYADAKWFYETAKTGDPVIVAGSTRPKADADNGYAGFNLTWQQWLAGSGAGAVTTT